jgi:type I restriction enzyme M protein
MYSETSTPPSGAVVKPHSERFDVNPSTELVNKLWRLCALLRKDGVTYQQYVTELTYLLFLKMASEQKDESRIPGRYRWKALKSANEAEVLTIYKRLLIDLGDAVKVSDRSVVAIFQNAATVIRTPANLRQLIDAIDALHWFSEERDAFGDAYEGLLQRMAEETKRGAGQYFTPRALIKALVELMQPEPGEVIQDPAAGTGGFLIAANLYMKAKTDDYFNLSPRQQSFQLKEALRGLENVPDTYRLLQMNLHLHGIDPNNLDLADTLSPAGQAAKFKKADLILTNPPFGPAGGPPTRDDLTITDRVSSYQLPFVEHCIRGLHLGGRAAVLVPDNVLFDPGSGKALRQMLMNRCNLHTILRLPVGLFYAQGVKTNVIFFTRSTEEAPRKDATKAVWIYDLRSQAPSYGKTNPFCRADLDEFVAVFGDDPLGTTPRQDQGSEGRFRRFTRKQIAERDDNLDITWLKDTSADAEHGLDTPEDIAEAIEGHLATALAEVRALLGELDGAPAEVEALEVAE